MTRGLNPSSLPFVRRRWGIVQGSGGDELLRGDTKLEQGGNGFGEATKNVPLR